MKFEWDTKKEKRNIQKHGVSFEQASYVFSDPYALNKYDNGFLADEDRWILLGKAFFDTILIVVHTYRGKNGTELTRIISARKATKKEKQAYQARYPK